MITMIQFKLTFKNLLQWIAVSSFIILAGLILFIRFSPYQVENGTTQKAIKNEVIINCPVETAFDYMSSDDNMKNKLEYLDHTKTIKSASKDNSYGKITRFFCNSDEKGQCYDGMVIGSVQNKKRKIKLYNFVEFPLSFDEITNEQNFKKLTNSSCKLTFKLLYQHKNIGVWNEIKAQLSSYRVKNIISKELKNIKFELEKQILLEKF